MSQKIKLEAIVLDTIRWKDSSAISHILTDEYGKVSLISQGIYLEKKFINPAALQTLSLSNLIVSKGKNMFYLSEVESTNRMDIITKESRIFLSSYVIIEILLKGLEEGFSISNIYPLTKTYLYSIGKNDAFILTAAWIFKFMSFMGYRPIISDKNEDHYYLTSDGIVTSSESHGEYMILDRLEREFISHMINNKFEDIKNSDRGNRMLDLAVRYAIYNLEFKSLNSYESIKKWGKYATN